MKISFSTTFLIVILCAAAIAQLRKPVPLAKGKPTISQKSPEIGQTAVVIDDTLSVLRIKPSLFSDSVQRMHRGRKVQILGVAEADGVKFYLVSAPPAGLGWVQAEAVFGKFRPRDEERLAQLVPVSEGF